MTTYGYDWEREERRRRRQEEIDVVAEENDVLFELLDLHLQSFPAATRRMPQLQVPDQWEIEEKYRRAELKGVPLWRRDERRMAKQRAQRSADAEFRKMVDAAKGPRDAEQARLDKWWKRLQRNDPAAVSDALEETFMTSRLPTELVHFEGDQALVVVMLPPPVDVVPSRDVGETEVHKKPTLRKRSKAEINDLYYYVIASAVVVTAKQAFAAVPGLTMLNTVVLQKDDQLKKVSPIFVGFLSRTELKGLTHDEMGAVRLIEATEHRLDVRGKSEIVVPVPENVIPELPHVLRKIASDLRYEVEADRPEEPEEEDTSEQVSASMSTTKKLRQRFTIA